MLLIQHIKLEWYKESRGAPDSTARNRLEPARRLPARFFDYNPIGTPSHYLFLVQEKTDFIEQINRIEALTELEKVKVGCLEIVKNLNAYDVHFKYVHSNGDPVRTNEHRKTAAPFTHEHDDSIYGMLNEIAMTLKPGEYGRIMHNGKHIGYDTGHWYYQKDIVNIINSPDKVENLDIFLGRKPDKTYDQLVHPL